MPSESTATTRDGDRRIETLLLAAIAALLVLLFHVYGAGRFAPATGRSVFVWIANQWAEAGADFSHGWLMPLVSLYIIRRRRKELAAAPKQVCWQGMAVVAACLLLHLAATRAQQPRFSLIAFTGLLWGIPLLAYGRRVASLLLFPCAYLLLCFTSYFLVNFSFPLRLLSTVVSTHLLNGLGIAAVRSGTAIFSAAGGGFTLNVADPCSGLRSLFVMTALAAPYAFFGQKTLVGKWTLFVLSIPLAIVANVLRIVTVSFVAQGVGTASAFKLWEYYSGQMVFFFAVLLLVGTSALIDRSGLERIWKRRETASAPSH